MAGIESKGKVLWLMAGIESKGKVLWLMAGIERHFTHFAFKPELKDTSHSWPELKVKVKVKCVKCLSIPAELKVK